MVILEFEVDQRSLDDARAVDLRRVPVELLGETLFVMPVRCVVDETVISDTPTGIFYLASEGLNKLTDLPMQKSIDLFPPGFTLSLRLRGDEVEIQPVGGRPGRIPYKELLAVWEDFAKKVRNFLFDEFPLLGEHREIGAWFRGEEEMD